MNAQSMNPGELRREADRIEAEELKAERLKSAGKIPTCPECGGRSFEVATWTIVSQSICYDEDDDEDACEWDDDYESGDHTDLNHSATCNDCGADARAMLESHGWKFYADPAPADPLSVTDPEPEPQP